MTTPLMLFLAVVVVLLLAIAGFLVGWTAGYTAIHKRRKRARALDRRRDWA